MGKKKEAKEDKVYLLRLAGTNPDCVEYIMGKVEGEDLTEMKDILRAICRLVPHETFNQGQDGKIHKGIGFNKQWSYYDDEFFTEQGSTIHRTAVLMHRELGSEEALYKNYIASIEEFYDSKAKAEAEKIANEKFNEIKNKRKNKDSKEAEH